MEGTKGMAQGVASLTPMWKTQIEWPFPGFWLAPALAILDIWGNKQKIGDTYLPLSSLYLSSEYNNFFKVSTTTLQILGKLMLKFIRNCQEFGKRKTLLKNKYKVSKMTLVHFKTQNKLKWIVQFLQGQTSKSMKQIAVHK